VLLKLLPVLQLSVVKLIFTGLSPFIAKHLIGQTYLYLPTEIIAAYKYQSGAAYRLHVIVVYLITTTYMLFLSSFNLVQSPSSCWETR
jgi:hypothetical protein